MAVTLETTTLVCPSCGGRTSLPNNSDRFVCEYCGNMHAFQLPRPNGRGGELNPQNGRKRARLTPRPDSVDIRKVDGRIELSWRWFSARYLAMLAFVIAWDAFLVFWYSMAFGSGGAPWIMFVFPIAHVAVGLTLTYTTLAGLFNRTTIKIDRREFIVHHDPFPWPGEVKVPVGELDQFYCTRKVSQGKNGTSVTFQLRAILKDGRERKLVSNLDSPEVGFFLERQVERILRIPDRHVAGELA